MKKSLIAIAVSAAVAAPAIASADVTLSGDSRIRMHSIEAKFDNGPDLVEQSSDSRVRLKVDAKGDGYFMHSRIKYTDGTLGTTAKSSQIKGEYGWVGVELGPVTIEGGRLNDNWGNRLTSWDVNWDGIQASFNAGPVSIALWRATNSEGGTYDKKGLATTGLGSPLPTKSADSITYAADITGKAGMGQWGVRITSDTIEKGATGGKAVNGSSIDGFYRGQIGPGMLLAEVYQGSGDYYKNANGDTPNAVYAHWIQNLGKFYYQVAGAQTNRFQADSHFGPFSTVGTSQDTAIMNMGGGGLAGTTFESMTVYALFGGMQVMPGSTLQLGLGSITAKYAKGMKDSGGTAIDLQFKHKVSKSATVAATYGTVSMDKKLFGTKATATAMGAYASIKF